MSEQLPFESVYRHGFARVAACTIPVAVADPPRNAAAVIAAARAAHDEGAAVAVFPELCLTGYAIDDLVMQDVVLDAARAAIDEVVAASRSLRTLLVVGAPLQLGARLYNCAVVIHRGAVLGVAPKSYLPTYREFYERRQIAPPHGRKVLRQYRQARTACCRLVQQLPGLLQVVGQVILADHLNDRHCHTRAP